MLWEKLLKGWGKVYRNAVEGMSIGPMRMYDTCARSTHISEARENAGLICRPFSSSSFNVSSTPPKRDLSGDTGSARLKSSELTPVVARLLDRSLSSENIPQTPDTRRLWSASIFIVSSTL